MDVRRAARGLQDAGGAVVTNENKVFYKRTESVKPIWDGYWSQDLPQLTARDIREKFEAFRKDFAEVIHLHDEVNIFCRVPIQSVPALAVVMVREYPAVFEDVMFCRDCERAAFVGAN